MKERYRNAASNLLNSDVDDGPTESKPHCDFCAERNEFTGEYPIPLEYYRQDHPNKDEPENGVDCVIINDHIVEFL